jgi:hypothetical protein
MYLRIIVNAAKLIFICLFSSPCQRQCGLLSFFVRRPLTFHILIFSSETPQPNEVKLGREHLLIWPSGFRNQPIRNKNCLRWPCLLTDRDEMSTFYRGHAIDASYQVSVHLAKWLFFVRRPLTFHILIFSSETPQPNEVKLGREHLWKVLSKKIKM